MGGAEEALDIVLLFVTSFEYIVSYETTGRRRRRDVYIMKVSNTENNQRVYDYLGEGDIDTLFVHSNFFVVRRSLRDVCTGYGEEKEKT